VEKDCAKGSCESSDLQLRLLPETSEVLIVSNQLAVYDSAVAHALELLAQVLDEFKRFCDNEELVPADEGYIKRREKFNEECEITVLE